MKKDYLAERGFERLMLVRHNRDAWSYVVLNARGREAELIDFAWPEIPRDGGYMWISEERSKIRNQTLILRCRSSGERSLQLALTA